MSEPKKELLYMKYVLHVGWLFLVSTMQLVHLLVFFSKTCQVVPTYVIIFKVRFSPNLETVFHYAI